MDEAAGQEGHVVIRSGGDTSPTLPVLSSIVSVIVLETVAGSGDTTQVKYKGGGGGQVQTGVCKGGGQIGPEYVTSGGAPGNGATGHTRQNKVVVVFYLRIPLSLLQPGTLADYEDRGHQGELGHGRDRPRLNTGSFSLE